MQLQTYCSGFLGRSLKISCAIHVLFFALMGMTFTAMNKPAKVVEQYTFINMEQPNEQIAVKSVAQDNSEQVLQMNQAIKAPTLSENRTAVSQQAAVQTSHPSVGGHAGHGEQASNNNAIGKAQEIAQGQSGTAIAAEKNDGAYQAVNIAQLASEFANLVEAKKEYPYMALKRGETGRVGVFVRLNADGSLDAAQVLQSSGVKTLDASAIKAVKKACPFVHGTKQVLEFMIPICYELKE